jgi:hypothetical protein
MKVSLTRGTQACEALISDGDHILLETPVYPYAIFARNM